MRPSKLFVGIGNVLQGDDGIGVWAAHVMASWPLPKDIEVYDGGTVGLEGAPMLENRRLVVVVDAIDASREPGEIFRLSPDQLRRHVKRTISLHDLHLLDAFEETRLLGTEPKQVIVFAVQIRDLVMGMNLSPPVEAALPRVLKLAAHELGLPPGRVESAALGSGWCESFSKEVQRDQRTELCLG